MKGLECPILTLTISDMKKEEQGKNIKDLKVEEMYTTLSEAKKELARRLKDKDLQKKVKEYLGEIPKPFKKEPRAVISRSIITPNQELFYFLDLAKHADLKPIGLEGVEDKFCTKNYDKVSLGKLTFLDCNGNKNKLGDKCKKSVTNVIDLQDSDGKKLCDIKTLWGEGLVDFHGRMLESYGVDIEKFDDFRWFNHKKGKSSVSDYYKKVFTLFMCHGILFENFITKRNEKSFTDDIVSKSFKYIEKKFGAKPLIVPLLPIEDDDHWYFRSYEDRRGVR